MNVRKSGILFLKGVCLGLSMVLPGVSGGTVAFVLGIYEKLLDEFIKVNFKHMKILFNLFTFKKEKFYNNFFSFVKIYDWSFILPLLLGAFLALVLFVWIASPLIEKYSVEFYSLVLALIVISLYKPFQKMKKNYKTFFLLILSSCINFLCFYVFQEYSIVNREIDQYLFLPTGFLVAVTFIVPGISGSYILILLGLYQTTLEILRNFDLIAILFLFLGMILGFVVTVRFIKKLITQYLDETLAVIIGLILGSLYSLWSFIEMAF